MSDSLRDRIAGLARFHIPVDYAGYIECSCGTECKPDHGGIDVAEQMWGDHLADAVIAELRDWDLIDQLIDAAGPRCFGKGER